MNTTARAWMYVQDQGEGMISFVGASRVDTFRFGSTCTHQFVVGDLTLVPGLVVATDTLRGKGLASLATYNHDLSAMLRDGELLLGAPPS